MSDKPKYNVILTADEEALLKDWEYAWDEEDECGDRPVFIERRKTPRVPLPAGTLVGWEVIGKAERPN